MTFDEVIIPYEGISSIRLYSNIEEVKKILDDNCIIYEIELWGYEYKEIENPWKVIIIKDFMYLFFAKNDKLFKIGFWEKYTGKLPNGICTGMDLDEALAIDSTIVFDDWNEDYESENGYWFEDNLDTKTIMDISIFIKELLDDNLFDSCEW